MPDLYDLLATVIVRADRDWIYALDVGRTSVFEHLILAAVKFKFLYHISYVSLVINTS